MSFLARQWTLLMAALQFLTRLPVPGPQIDFYDPDLPARSSRYFPLVGHLVGLLCAVVWLAARWLWPAPVAAVLAVGVGVLLTGALHEDGLADTVDGLGGGSDLASKLAILKDSRVGSFGAVALVLVLGLRIAALSGQSLWTGALALVAAHGLGRAAATLAMAVTPYAGDAYAAKGRDGAARPTAGEALFALAWGLLPFIVVWWPLSLAALSLAIGAGLLVTSVAKRMIGGHTGDILGAVEQAVETAVLLGCGIALVV